MTYVIKDLNDLADLFELRASGLLNRQLSAKPMESKDLAARINTWKTAADIVRNTVLET